MAVEITSAGDDSNPGFYSNQRRLCRTENGVLWALFCDTTVPRLEFHRSLDNGATWVEDSSQRINGIFVGAGASMRIIGNISVGERIACIYRNSSTNRMEISFGRFESASRGHFVWHSASPERVSKEKSSNDFTRPDIEGYYDGSNWLIPCTWSELSGSGKAVVWFGRQRYVPYECYTAVEQLIHDRFNMSTFARPSISLRHLSDHKAINTASPDAYLAWHQGIDIDTGDRRYMVRMTKSETNWQATQNRFFENGVQSGLTSSCFTGQRAAFANVPSNTTEEIELILMQPSDGSRDVLNVPSLSLGELTNLSVTWDNYSADIWILATGTSNRRPHYIRYDWVSRTWDSWVEVNTDTVMEDTLSAKPGSSDSRIEFCYLVDTGAAVSFRHELAATTNVAPDAPTPTLASGAYSVAASLPVTWTHNDADGDPQDSYRFRRSVNGGTFEYWNGATWQASLVSLSSATQGVTLSAGWGSDGDIIEYTIATKDLQSWSPWSQSLTAVGSTIVTPTINEPSAGSYPDPTVVVEWTVSEQSAYRVRVLLTSDSSVVADSGWSGSSTVRTYESSAQLEDGVGYTIEVTTQNAEGLASAPVTVAITVSLTPPPVPTFSVVADPDEGTLTVDIDNGTPGGGETDAADNLVYRLDDDDPEGEFVLLAGSAVADGSYVDRSCASGRNYTYQVVARTAVGATATSA